MKIGWPEFKRNPHFFLSYFFVQMVSSVLLLALLMMLRNPLKEQFQSGWLQFVALPFAFLFGVQLPAMLHNAVHHNIRPRWLNELIGELGGFFVLFGLAPFRISHFFHHAFADSESDPHPPEGKGFMRFLITTQINTIKVIRGKFLAYHGHTLKNHAVLIAEMMFYYVSLVARLLSWFWLLGPTWFVFLYVPAYLTNVLVFAHINFATHHMQDNGEVTIINLNHNAYYRFVNYFGSGVYFHRNHHEKPFLYNPAKG